MKINYFTLTLKTFLLCLLGMFALIGLVRNIYLSII